MKMIERKYTVRALVGLLLALSLYAQNMETGENQIELPDLTTVVTGSSDSEDYAPAPSFEDVLEIPYDSGTLIPLLPKISVNGDEEAGDYADQNLQKNIYAEGQIGGGYPASFIGDFQIARLYGADPFKIAFTHESSSGYAGHNLADGFNNAQTAIAIERDFIRKNIQWGFGASYKDESNGLQSKAEGLAANNLDAVGVKANFLWQLPHSFNLALDADSHFYYRFADITKSSSLTDAVPDWIVSTSRVSAEPALHFFWEDKGFNVGLRAKYNLEAWKKAANRGQFNLDFSWQNEKVKLYTNAGLVIGNLTGSKSLIVPFTLGLDTVLPVYFSDRQLNLSLSGGLCSERKTTEQLEHTYAYSGLKDLSSEISDWYGSFNLLVPLKSSFTGNISAGFFHTAFDNGIWTPDYNAASLTKGLYGYSQKNRFELFTDFAFTWKYKLFAATAKYHANWIDLPVLENRHSISVDFALQSEKGSWGINLDTRYLLDAADYKPFINLEAYVQAADAVRIVLSVNDMLKLLGAEERMYAGQYVANSGNVSLLVKFLF